MYCKVGSVLVVQILLMCGTVRCDSENLPPDSKPADPLPRCLSATWLRNVDIPEFNCALDCVNAVTAPPSVAPVFPQKSEVIDCSVKSRNVLPECVDDAPKELHFIPTNTGHHFFSSMDQKSWFGAQKFCHSNNLNFGNIDNVKTEQEIATFLASAHKRDPSLFGGSTRSPSNMTFWVSAPGNGSKPLVWSDFNSPPKGGAQPVKKTSRCLYHWRSNNGPKLQLGDCREQRSFFCSAADSCYTETCLTTTTAKPEVVTVVTPPVTTTCSGKICPLKFAATTAKATVPTKAPVATKPTIAPKTPFIVTKATIKIKPGK